MATIGSIAVKIRADSRKFVGDISRARGGLAKFKAGVLAASGALKVMGIAAAAAAAGGILLLGKRQLATIDQTAKLADVLGSTIGQIEALRLAATLTGGSAEQMDKALQFIAKSVGEAASGISREAIPAFVRLGLNFKELNKQSPADTFIDMAEGLNALKSPNERAAISMRLMGRAGKELVLTLKLGRKGLMDIRREVSMYGLDLDRAQAFGVESFNDSMARLGASFRGLGNTIALAFAPLDKFVDLLATGVSIVNVFAKTLLGQDTFKEMFELSKRFGMTPESATRPNTPRFKPPTGVVPAVVGHSAQFSRGGLMFETNSLLRQILQEKSMGVTVQ